MTLSADYAFDVAPDRAVTYVLNGSRFLTRLAFRLGAVTLAFVALFVWLAPGAAWESDVMLFKLALSVLAGFGAVAMWLHSQPVTPPAVEVDVVNREIRLIRDGAPQEHRLIERCAFADLHGVDLRGRHITFWAGGGRLLAEVSLNDARTYSALLTALRDMGKLA